METPFEDGLYLAVLYNVFIILRSFLFCRADDCCMHAADKAEWLEYGVQCR